MSVKLEAGLQLSRFQLVLKFPQAHSFCVSYSRIELHQALRQKITKQAPLTAYVRVEHAY